jgi:hypothetical protein
MDGVANMIAQQIAAALPTIVAQVNASQGTGGNRHIGTTEGENRDRPEGSRDRPIGCSYKAFMGCKPKEFYGNEGTIEALRWINEIELILDISKCAEEDKVRYVSRLLHLFPLLE